MATSIPHPASPAGGAVSTEETWDLATILAILRSRRRVILATIILALLVGAVITFRAPRLYPAHATLIIQSDTTRMLSAQDPLGSYMLDEEFFQTQYRVITSQSVVNRAIAAAKMDEWTEFQNNPNLSEAIAGSVQLTPVRDSRMVTVLYEGPDPRNAVKLVNALVDSFEAEFRETRRREAETGLSSLGGSLAEIETEISRREGALRDYMKANNITTTDPNFSVPYLQLQEIARRETSLLAQTYELDAQVKEMQKAGNELQAILGTDSLLGQQRLGIYDQSLNAFLAERDKLLQTYGPQSSEIVALDRQIGTVRQNQRLLAQQLVAGVVARRDALKAALEDTRKRKAELDAEVQHINAHFVEVERLRSNLRQAQDRYQEVMAGQARGQVFGQMAVNPVVVVERPTVAQLPSKPRRTLNLALALLLGIVFGVGLAFALELLDDSVRGLEDLEKIGGIHALGVVPQMKDVESHAERLQIVSAHPHAIASESLRRLRALLDLGFPPETGQARVFLVSSAQAGEGKTTVATNLALAMAQNDRRVLWVDADMRHPTDVTMLGLPPASPGLAEYLAGEGTPEQFVRTGSVPALDILPSGKPAKNAGELLTHARLGELIEWARSRYTAVVLDTPPVLLVSDALVLSPLADVGLVVVSGAKTRRPLVRHAAQSLQRGGLNVAGAILNDPLGRLFQAASRYGYGYGYGYGQSGSYYQGRDEGTVEAKREPESAHEEA